MISLKNSTFDFLKKQYATEGRYWHTWRHIQEMLKLYAKFFDEIENKEAVYLAILFHDVVYNVVKQEVSNEKLSAMGMKDYLRENEYEYYKESKYQIDLAFSFIVETEHHDLSKVNKNSYTIGELNDLKLFFDFDISIFKANKKEDILFFEESIRKEYQIYSDDVYNQGRKAVMQGFLNQKTIFNSYQFKEFEKQAKENIQFIIDQF